MSSDSPSDSWHDASDTDGEIADFCSDLRADRQAEGISLEIIAARTSIPLTVLRALEGGQWDEIQKAFLPGYLRQYAQTAGLNADQILARFRKLTKGHLRANRAEVDDTGDLLSTHEFVGATRMKIVLGGFVGSRRFTFVLFVFLLAAFLGTIVSANRVPRAADIEMPFDQILRYAQSMSRGPIEFIPQEAMEGVGSKELGQPRTPPALRNTATYDLIASESCFIMFRRGDGVEYRRRLQALDTLRIPISDSLFVTVNPRGHAGLFARGERILSKSSTAASVDTFEVSLRLDKSESAESMH